MQDEIEFLKEDLMSILRSVKDSTELILRTGTVFYRDQGDSYLTKHSAFTEDISTTVKFISNQKAAGGGDYEEAVHSALEASLQDLSWKENGRARLAFFWLNHNDSHPDAPEDMFFCTGHDGQQIFIIPSHDLVVVILGYSPKPDGVIDFNRLLKDIITQEELIVRN
jgi:CubicO group peptidase (beta-lactamase class C family)